MSYEFLKIDLASATFTGLSSSAQRMFALAATLTIFVGLIIACYWISIELERRAWSDAVSLVVANATLVYYILGRGFLLAKAAAALAEATPLGVVYRKDKAVVDRAEAELLSVARKVDFVAYLPYGRLNPSIRGRSALVVIAHQKRGDLKEWVKDIRNLKKLADLVYQLRVAEEVLATDGAKILSE